MTAPRIARTVRQISDAPYAVAEVRLWDTRVGAVAEDRDGRVTFEYEPAFVGMHREISPMQLGVAEHQGPLRFDSLRNVEAFFGLPGVLADALPDRFGNAIIASYFAARGRPDAGLSPVQKLLYIGDRAMGALEFRPALADVARAAEQEALEVADLVAAARRVIEGDLTVTVPEIMQIGASAGGARAKALILWNPVTNRVRSGFAKPEPGEESWLIKFDGVGEMGTPDHTARAFNRIEFACNALARDAGIDVAVSHLLEERGFGHFMSRRFDRIDAAAPGALQRKLHLHSLAGMQHIDYNTPRVYSYEAYFRTVLALNLGEPALEEAFRRMVFNVLLVNQDDHPKNFAFLMDEHGRWRLSPAYDLTYARGHGYTRLHQMTLNGKAGDFSREDLLTVGRSIGLSAGGAAVIAEVTEAMSGWQKHASAAGVPAAQIAALQQQFRSF